MAKPIIGTHRETRPTQNGRPCYVARPRRRRQSAGLALLLISYKCGPGINGARHRRSRIGRLPIALKLRHTETSIINKKSPQVRPLALLRLGYRGRVISFAN